MKMLFRIKWGLVGGLLNGKCKILREGKTSNFLSEPETF